MRGYGVRFKDDLASADDTLPGVKLARLCVDARLSAVWVAKLLGVTRATVYSWFRGHPPNAANVRQIQDLINIIKADFVNGLLPCNDSTHARYYMEKFSSLNQDQTEPNS